MFHLLAAFAEFEQEFIRERVKTGLANAGAKRKVLVGPRRVVNPETARELRGRRVSLRAIAKATGMSTGMVRRVLAKRRIGR